MGVVAALAVKITGDTKDFDSAITGIGKSVDTASGKVAGFAGQVKSSWGLIGTAVSALGVTQIVDNFVDATSAIADMSAKTGIGVRELEKLQYAGDLVGISLEQISSAASMLQNRIAGGDKSAVAALEEMGLTVEDMLGLDPGDMFIEVADAIARIPDPARQTALAMDVFGRSGATLLPLIRSNVKDVAKEFEMLGFGLGPELVAAGDAVGDMWTRLGYAGDKLVAMVLGPIAQNLEAHILLVKALRAEWKNAPLPKVGAPSLFAGQTTKGLLAGSTMKPSEIASVEKELARELEQIQKGQDREAAQAARRRADSIKAFDEFLRNSTPRVVSGLTQMPGTELPMPVGGFLPRLEFTSGSMFRGDGLWGLSSMPGIQMPMPEPPKAGPDPSFFRRAFGGDFGHQFGQTVMSALTGGGDLLKSLGGLGLGQIGKSLVAGFSESFSGSFLGKALGGILPGLGAAIGPLIDGAKALFNKLFGNAGRDLVKDFAASFGGFDAMHDQLLTMGDAGEQLWIKLTQGVGRNNPEQAKKVIEEVTKAMEAYKQAVSDIIAGTNARAANVTDQNDLNVVSAGAMAAFQLQIQQGVSAVAALQAITPAITAMRDALAGGNLEMTASAERLLYLSGIIEQNKIQFDNLAASGQILTAMLQGNIRDGALFAAVSFDIGQQIQSIIDKGVPTAQVFALAQPQLQALWEAQTRWGFAVDETTQALLTEAETQGFVGEHMRSANEKILQVLIAIGDVLGAQIPDALRGLPPAAQAAASGIQAAFKDGINVDVNFRSGGFEGSLPGGGNFPDFGVLNPGDYIIAPAMQAGGYVPPRSGGTLVRLGEGGEGEHVVPDSKMGGVTVHVHGSLIHQDDLGEVVANAAASAIRTNRGDSYTRMTAALGI